MNFSYYAKQVRRFGYQKTAYEFGIRVLEKLLPYHEYICLSLRFRPANAAEKKHQPHDFSAFEFKKLSLKELHAYSEQKSLDLSANFLTSLETRKDVCFGLVEKDSGQLACYCFFSPQATEVQSRFFFYFPEKWIYVYKAFSHPLYRGKRLLPYLLNKAAATFEEATGYVTLIQAHNLASLRSFESLEFIKIQSFHMFKLPTRDWSIQSFASVEEGVRIAKAE